MTRLKLGTIGNADDNPYSKIKPDVINSKKHKNLAKEVAVKSIVLLKNKNNLLPLKKEINTLICHRTECSKYQYTSWELSWFELRNRYPS